MTGSSRHAHIWLGRPAAGARVVAGAGCRHTRWWGTEPVARVWASVGPSGRWCAPPGLQRLPTGMYPAVEAGDGDQPGRVQVHGWKGQVTSVHLAGGVNLRGLGWYLAPCRFRGLGRLPVQILGSGGARGGWGAGSRWLGIGIPMGKAEEACGPGHWEPELLTAAWLTLFCLSFAGL